MTAVIIENPRENVAFGAALLRAHCRLLAVGFKAPKGMTKGQVLDKASALTGVSYKRGEYGKAADDLTKLLNR